MLPISKINWVDFKKLYYGLGGPLRERELAFGYIDELTSHIEMNQTGEITHTYVSLANVCRVPYLTATGAISIRNGAI